MAIRTEDHEIALVQISKVVDKLLVMTALVGYGTCPSLRRHQVSLDCSPISQSPFPGIASGRPAAAASRTSFPVVSIKSARSTLNIQKTLEISRGLWNSRA